MESKCAWNHLIQILKQLSVTRRMNAMSIVCQLLIILYHYPVSDLSRKFYICHAQATRCISSRTVAVAVVVAVAVIVAVTVAGGRGTTITALHPRVFSASARVVKNFGLRGSRQFRG